MNSSSCMWGAAAGVANFFGLAIVTGPTATPQQRTLALPLIILPVVGVYRLRVDDYAAGLITAGLGLGALAIAQDLLAPTTTDRKYDLTDPLACAWRVINDMGAAISVAGGPALIVLLAIPPSNIFHHLGLSTPRWYR